MWSDRLGYDNRRIEKSDQGREDDCSIIVLGCYQISKDHFSPEEFITWLVSGRFQSSFKASIGFTSSLA